MTLNLADFQDAMQRACDSAWEHLGHRNSLPGMKVKSATVGNPETITNVVNVFFDKETESLIIETRNN